MFLRRNFLSPEFLIGSGMFAIAIFAVFLKATFFSEYWRYLPFSATPLYGVFIGSLCGLALYNFFAKKRSIVATLWTVLMTALPAITVFFVAIIARSLEYTVLKTTYAEFDLVVVAWLLVFTAVVVVRSCVKHSTQSATGQQGDLNSSWRFIGLVLAVGVFLVAGLYHLERGAYVDERLWTYSNEKRLEKYWNNILERDWAHTRPSDKPGVTLAILEGPSLLFVTPSQFAAQKGTDAYIADKKGFAQMLFAMRLPLVLFGALALVLFYNVIVALFARRIAFLATLFIATSPILIGMSRIVNPDALTWIFMPLALLAYLATFKRRHMRWVVLTGVLLGLSLLTKYIATIFIVFFPVVLLYEALALPTSQRRSFLAHHIRALGVIALIALSTIALLYPGVWVRADRLLITTLWSQPFATPLWQIVLTAMIAVFVDVRYFRARFATRFIALLAKPLILLRRITPFVILLSAALVVIATMTQWPAVPFEDILSSPKTSTNDGANLWQAFLTAFYVLLYSIHPIAYAGFIASLALLLREKHYSSFLQRVLFYCLLFIAFFYSASLASTTVPIVRYQIMLYPIAFLCAAIGINYVIRHIGIRLHGVLFSVLLVMLSFSLVRIAPLYFSYNSALLPANHIINPKDMGDGSYEAAQWLNALPNAEALTIWTDKRGVCTFFVGHCAHDVRKKYFIQKGPRYDYYVVSYGRQKRTVNLSTIYARGREDYPVRLDTLYTTDVAPVFEIHPGNRTRNYVRIYDARDVDVWRGPDVVVQPPTFPQRDCSIVDAGARTDDQAATTQAFARAIATCADAGGGRVVVPAGIWRTGAIVLRDNINLFLEDGATISFSANPDDYLPVVRTRFIGMDLYNYAPAIYAPSVENVAITGRGIIDGNGPAWPDFIDTQRPAIKRLYAMAQRDVPIKKRVFGTRNDALRPSLIQFHDAENILVSGVTIRQGPMWTLHFVYSNNITVRDLRIIADDSNTDGIVIDSSQNVAITQAQIASGDDAIAIKSGRDRDGRRMNKPTRNVVISDVTITKAHAGIAIGSEMSGGIADISVRDVSIAQANRGLRIKTRPGRGGYVRNVVFKNIDIEHTREAESIQITMDYGSRTIRPKERTPLPLIENIVFDTITTFTTHPTKYPIAIEGLPGRLRNITMRNITMRGDRRVTLSGVDDVLFSDVSAILYTLGDDIKDVTIQQHKCPRIVPQRPETVSLQCL